MTRRKNDYSDWSKEELIDHIWQLRKRKKYGLVWDVERTKEKFETDAKNRLPVLKEAPGLAVETDPGQPTHILIEGDNYHALTILNYTHEKSVDIVYIDPPYNLGEKDFRYNDQYVDKDDSYRHSKWLSFMEKRLMLAKNLLTETGVIFISIDQNEGAQLKLLCDDIFGEDNLVSWTVVAKGTTTGQDAKKFGSSVDFLLVYGMSAFVPGKVELSEKDKKRFSREDERGKYAILQWRKTGKGDKKEDRPNLYYPIINPDGVEVLPVGPSPEHYKSRWRGNYQRFKQLVTKDMVEWVDKDGLLTPYIKYYLDGRTKAPSNLWIDVDGNKKATSELKQVVGNHAFDNPKPTELIEKCIKLANRPDPVILDFFAGSGTTAQAVLQLNAERGGGRQCILVTNNENNIMTDVCYPRIQRVMQGYEYSGKTKELVWEKKINLNTLRFGKADDVYEEYKEKREETKQNFGGYNQSFENNKIQLLGVKKIEGWKDGLGGNLRFYRTDFVPAEPTDENKETLTFRATEMLCLRENTFDPVEETDLWKIFENDQQYTGILYDQLKIPEFKVALEKLDHKSINVYVFSYGDDNFGSEFSDMGDRVNVQSIPEAILRVYRRIYQ